VYTVECQLSRLQLSGNAGQPYKKYYTTVVCRGQILVYPLVHSI